MPVKKQGVKQHDQEEQPLLRNQDWSPFEDSFDYDTSQLSHASKNKSVSILKPGVKSNDRKEKRSKSFSRKNKRGKKNFRKDSLISLKSTRHWTRGFFLLNSTTLPEPGLYTRHYNDYANGDYDGDYAQEEGYADIPYEIQYSIFKPPNHHSQTDDSSIVPHVTQSTYENNFNNTYIPLPILSNEHSGSTYDENVNYLSTREKYLDIIQESIYTIHNYRIQPVRIQQGSSGSYFVYGRKQPYRNNRIGNLMYGRGEDNDNNHNDDNSEEEQQESFQAEHYPEFEILGVFKPKDEEPYGPLSPKWTKWLHRTFFPCFFGRTCLIPNLGYICESAASLLDQKLKSNIVPFTDTIVLESSSFFPKKSNIIKNFLKKKLFFNKTSSVQVQRKIGSYQLFLKGYINADSFFELYPLPGMNEKYARSNTATTTSAAYDHQQSHSNIKHSNIWTVNNGSLLAKFRLELEKLVVLDYLMRNTDRGFDNWMIKLVRDPETNLPIDIKLAAIDNALTFPWKHPDEWRSFPYGWLYLPINILNVPFHKKTRDHFLQILTDVKWWEKSFQDFTELFSRDSEFQMRLWLKQWAVFKGQAFNIVETMKQNNQGPLELVRRTRCVVVDEHMDIEILDPNFFKKNLMTKIDIETNIPQPTFTSPMKLSYQSSNVLDENWRHLLNGEIDDETWTTQKDAISASPEVPQENTDPESIGSIAISSFQNKNPLSPVNSSIEPFRPRVMLNKDLFVDQPITPKNQIDMPQGTSLGTDDVIQEAPPEHENEYEYDDDEDDDDEMDMTQYHDAVEDSRDYQSIFSKQTQKPRRKRKTVVIERLKLVTSKPPVFTWW